MTGRHDPHFNPHNQGSSGPDAQRTAASWLERKKRPCLRCGKVFNSQHAGHRICGPCKDGHEPVDRTYQRQPRERQR